jgi:hypothetical protein
MLKLPSMQIAWNSPILINILRIGVFAIFLVALAFKYGNYKQLYEITSQINKNTPGLKEQTTLKDTSVSTIMEHLKAISSHPLYTIKTLQIEKIDPQSRADQFNCFYQLQKFHLKERQ